MPGVLVFADKPLTARAERAPAALSEDVGRKAVASGCIPGSFVEPVGGGVAVYTGPDSPINKVIGVGFEEDPDAQWLDAIEALFTARGSGVQTALLAARLRDAARRGCGLAVVTTAPGSRSQRNAQRRGFALLYARALHVKAAPPL